MLDIGALKLLARITVAIGGRAVFLWRKGTPTAALSALFKFGVVAALLYWPTGLRARRALALVLALLARDAGTRDRVKG